MGKLLFDYVIEENIVDFSKGDLFIVDEFDFVKCNVMKSFLWELKFL